MEENELIIEVKKIAKKLEELGANHIDVLDISKKSKEIKFLIICNAFNQQLAKLLAKNLMEEIEKDKIALRNQDGFIKGEWIILDYSDFVVHIFVDASRAKYNLDKLWKDSKNQIKFN